MRKSCRTLVDSFAWASAVDLQIDLPKDALITQIDFRAVMTMSAALTAVQPDGLRRIVQNFKIESGGQSFLGMSGEQMGRLWSLMNTYDHGGANLITLQDGSAESITFRFHPGSNPNDPYDMSAVIPAQDLGELKATWSTTTNAVVDDTITISSGLMYATVWSVAGVNRAPGGKTPGLHVPISSTLSYAHSANFSDLSKELEIPTGSYLRRIVMLVQDETATRPIRKDDEVTRAGIYLGRESRRLIDADFEALKADSAARYGVSSVAFQLADVVTGHANIPDGFAIIDFRPYGHPLYGLDLRGYNKEDIKLLLTVANYTSGDDTIVWYDMVRPWA